MYINKIIINRLENDGIIGVYTNMIKKLICWLWGHKIMVKAFTGNKVEENSVEHLLFKWKKEDNCIRCGKHGQ